MIDLDELEHLVRHSGFGEDEVWCLHPNGYSVWSGKEYDSGNVQQIMVARAGVMTDEASFNTMTMLAELHPKAMLELIDRARGLSEVKLVHGLEDSEEVCVVCGHATSGHTHAECYANGKRDGAFDEDIDCSEKLSEALGIHYMGDHHATVIDQVKQLRADALTLAEALAKHDGHMSEHFQAAYDRVLDRG